MTQPTHPAALKSCPLCPDGGRPYFNPHTNDSTDDGSRMAYIGCASCGVGLKAANFPTMQGGWKLSKDIVSIWNTRTSSLTAKLEAAEKMAEAVEVYKRAVSNLHSLSGYNGMLWSEVPLLGPAPDHVKAEAKEKWDELNDTGVALNKALAHWRTVNGAGEVGS